jgi:hypothetical protein
MKQERYTAEQVISPLKEARTRHLGARPTICPSKNRTATSGRLRTDSSMFPNNRLRRLIARTPIFHIASMARCGETLLLRSLNAHPQLRVVHNLLSEDSPKQQALFHFLMGYRRHTIRPNHPLVRDLNVQPDEALVIKQGVWEHKYPFLGVVLVRNPVAVYASLRTYDLKTHGGTPESNWHYNEERLSRWLGDIEPELLSKFWSLSPPQQFSLFFNRRMGALARLGHPIIYYENLVSDPHPSLELVVKTLGVEWNPSVLESQHAYARDTEGHAHIDLSSNINDAPLRKYPSVLSRQEFNEIALATRSTCQWYRYELSWEHIQAPPMRNSGA